MGLKLTDLIGKMVNAKILASDVKAKSVIFELEYDKESFKVGVFKREVAEELLEKHGSSDKKGINFLSIPKSFLVENDDGIGKWVNNVY